MRITKLANQSVVAQISVGDKSLQIIANSTFFYTQEQLTGVGYGRPHIMGAFASEWTRVDLVLDLDAKESVLTLDGNEIERKPLMASWDQNALPSAEFDVGVRYSSPFVGGQLEVHVDDVLATAF